MPRVRRELRAGMDHVARSDPRFAPVVGSVPCSIPTRRPPASDFAALAESILHQQLAGAAAAAIHRRFVALFPDAAVTAAAVLAVPEKRLRGAGLSGNKAASIRDLAGKVEAGAVRLDGIARRHDADIVDELVQVRGIGRWTAEMFLIFQLGRLDVWPVDDLGVQQGYGHLHGLTESPKRTAFDALGDRYRPYRSVAAWYCWRAADSRPPR